MLKLVCMSLATLVFVMPMGCAAVGTAPTLKGTYRDFLVGAAIGPVNSFKPAEIDLLTTQFNALTPENCMKPKPVHPAEGTWNFAVPDAFIAFAQEHHMTVFGHTLVWHEQTPEWFFKDGEKAASRELVLARLKTHITTLVGRYKGKIRAWDVVNEAISDKDDEYLRKTPWLDVLGEDYIAEAFEFAHEADPKAELQYNDYSVESPAKRAKTLQLIKSLQEKGIPIASVGIQCHFSLDHVPFKDLEEAIKEFRAAGVKVAITELDLDVMPRQTTGADSSAKEAESLEMQKVKPCPPEVLARQAEQYAKLFALFEKHKADLVRVTFWGLDDAHTWLNSWPVKRYNHPLLFDRNGVAKPAFEAVIEAGK